MRKGSNYFNYRAFLFNCQDFFPLKQKKSAGIDLLSRTQPHSTIGAEGLDFCVRYGNRYIPFARDTSKLVYLFAIYVR